MATQPNAHHHIGIRTADLERSAQFYIDAFDAEWLTKAWTVDGEGAEQVLGGPKGAAYRVAFIAVGPGVFELFEFLHPKPEFGERPHPSELGLMHFGIQVDDVAATIERVVAAGGTRVWDHILDLGPRQISYVADPDGNVIEVMDGTMRDGIDVILQGLPEARPE
ncbi:MAG: VOC family protein [Solirubrobacteraceae bacterium]|nr:VOC family protein [Patulibacter sp.]